MLILTKEAAEQLKKYIWDAFHESDLDSDATPAIKLACSVIDDLVEGED